MKEAEAVFIAVGTPSRHGDGYADLSYVYAAAQEIARNLSRYTVIVTKSTVPVGTGREIAQLIREAKPKAEFDVCSNPEFLREGSAISDFMRPDRVVIGCESERAARGDEGALPPALSDRNADGHHRARNRRADQIRLQRLSGRPRSPSSTKSQICAKKPAPMCRWWPKAWGSIGASGANFCMQGRAMAVPAFPKIRWRLMRTARDKGVPLRMVETVDRHQCPAQEADGRAHHRGVRRRRWRARPSPFSA